MTKTEREKTALSRPLLPVTGPAENLAVSATVHTAFGCWYDVVNFNSVDGESQSAKLALPAAPVDDFLPGDLLTRSEPPRPATAVQLERLLGNSRASATEATSLTPLTASVAERASSAARGSCRFGIAAAAYVACVIVFPGPSSSDTKSTPCRVVHIASLAVVTHIVQNQMKLEAEQRGSHPDTREAPLVGALGGGIPFIAARHSSGNLLFTLFIEQYLTDLYKSATSMHCLAFTGVPSCINPLVQDGMVRCLTNPPPHAGLLTLLVTSSVGMTTSVVNSPLPSSGTGTVYGATIECSYYIRF